MKLHDYPRPPHENGWGIHGSAIVGWRPNDIASWFAKLRDTQLHWYVQLGSLKADDLDMVKGAVEAGLEPIVRLYAPRRFPHMLDPGELARAVTAYLGAGAHYFLSGNEPNLDSEWDGSFAAYQNRHIATITDLWLQDAKVIKAAGGIPLMYPVSVGSSQPDGRLAHWWWRDQIHELARRGALDSLDGAGWAVHIGTINHPLAYPLDPVNVADKRIQTTDACQAMLETNDSTCYQSIRLIQQVLQDAGLPDVPVLSTEGGTFPWMARESEDNRYPPCSPERQAQIMPEVLARFNPKHGEYWGDQAFCQCSWLGPAYGRCHVFDNDAWWGNPRYGGDLPVVAALRDAPRFERTLGEEVTPMGVPDICLAMVRPPAGCRLVVTQTCAEHLANREWPAVDVTAVDEAGKVQSAELRVPARAVGDFTSREDNNRGEYGGFVVTGTVLDVRQFEVWEPVYSFGQVVGYIRHPKGAYTFPGGAWRCHLEIENCHSAQPQAIISGEGLQIGDFLGMTGHTGMTDPAGEGGTHDHVIALLVQEGTGPAWAPWVRVNPELFRAAFAVGAAS